MNSFLTLAQASSEGGGVMGVIGMVLYVGFIIFMIASMWKIFTKASQPGWASIVPIFNTVIMLKIAGKPVWWIVLFLIPVVNFIVAIIVMIELAKSFGKGAGFGIGMVFLPFIFFPMLGFGSAQYQGTANF